MLILSFFLLSQHITALPLSSSTFVTTPSSDSESCQCPDSNNTRSTVDIIWSCIATMFACTWVAVHPNIPAEDETWYAIAIRRVKLMFWAIIAPEMIIFWAMRQWVNAKRIAEIYEDRKWTKAHGFFLQMGGFVLYDDKTSLGPLSFSRFGDLLSKGDIDFPEISAEQIQDRSKGDLLAKGVVAVQTFWFTVQCIARGIQGIGITELELITLAFAALNGIMYFFWWDKPLDVRCSIPVFLRKKEDIVSDEQTCSMTSPVEISRDQGNEDVAFQKLEVEDIQLNVSSEDDKLSGIVEVELQPASDPQSAYNEPTYEDQDTQAPSPPSHPTQIMHQIWHISWIILTMGLVDLLRPLDHMTQSPTSITILPGSKRVPTFYADISPPTVLYGLDIPSSFISLLFGGIHCIGFLPHFTFPSPVERILWRTCSLLITCIPVPFLGLAVMLYYKVHWRPPGLGRTLFHLFKRLIYISLVLYIIARLALFVQAFVSLRALPDDAFVTVDWTKFVPHVS